MLKRRKIGQELAFGKIPAYCKYEMVLANQYLVGTRLSGADAGSQRHYDET